MPGIIRRFVARISGLSSPAQASARRVLESPFIKARVDAAVRALSGVIVPGYDVDIVSSGVVTRVRVSMDGSRVAVYIDYYGRNPGCSFCKFISETLWNKIFREIEESLKREGFREVYILEAYTGAELYKHPGLGGG